MSDLNDTQTSSAGRRLTEKRKIQNREAQRKYRQKIKNRLETLEREVARNSQDEAPLPIETGSIDIQQPVPLPVDNIQSGMMFDGLELDETGMEGLGSFESNDIDMRFNNGTADFYYLANNQSDLFLDSFNDFAMGSDLLNQTPVGLDMSFDTASTFTNPLYFNGLSGSATNAVSGSWPISQPFDQRSPGILGTPNSAVSSLTGSRWNQVLRASPVSPDSEKSIARKQKRSIAPPATSSGENDLGIELIHALRLSDTPEHRSLIKTAVARGHSVRDVLLAGLGALSQTGNGKPPPPKIGVNLDIAKLGTLQAYLTIGKAMNFSTKILYDEASVSPFYQSSNNKAIVKHRAEIFPSLRPTPAQIMYMHHPWVDLLPFPSLRHKILISSLLDPPPFDVYELKTDIFMNDGITCWRNSGKNVGGQPWDMRCWEAERWFMEKYGFLFGEEDELRQQTNWWRWMRGEETK